MGSGVSEDEGDEGDEDKKNNHVQCLKSKITMTLANPGSVLATSTLSELIYLPIVQRSHWGTSVR